MMVDEMYMTDEAKGKDWTLWLGDSCERMTEMADNSVDLSVSSPPFASLYVYSDSTATWATIVPVKSSSRTTGTSSANC